MKTLSTTEFDQAKLDPTSVFARPEDVLATTLSPKEKKTILLRWQEDAGERMQATDEGMPPADNSNNPAEQLRAVQKALETLHGS
jgi:hypothetical protein